MAINEKYKEFFRALKFLVISISAGVIQIGSFTLFNEVLKWNYWVGYLISLLLSIIWNFTINRKFTFKSANNVKIAMLLVLAFYAVFTPVSTVLGDLAENSGVNEYIVLAVTMVLNFVLEFLFTRYVVYRNSCDTATKKEKKSDVAEVEEINVDLTEVTVDADEEIASSDAENLAQETKENLK
ncbi:MAG: GtrA family protein [Clostridiales bacterium]|nr:GtrA family protein [Clostridiales bacterium]